MKWTKRVLLKNSKLAFGFLLAIFAIGILLFYRLTSLPHGVSSGEAQLLLHGISLKNIYDNPLNLPVNFLQWLGIGLFHTHSVLLLRLPAVIFGAASLAIFALLLRRWYGLRTAIFGTAVFACAPWVLHVSRLAGTGSLQLFTVLAILYALVHISRNIESAWVFYGTAVVMSLLLYVPGAVWFVAVGLTLHLFEVLDGFKKFAAWWQRLLYLLAWLAPLSLLIMAFVRNTALWRPWLALPGHFAAPVAILKHIGTTLLAFVWRGPASPALWLDRVPLLNVFIMLMVVVGIYFYGRHWRAPRTRLLLGFFVISIALAAIGGSATLSFAVPIVYLVAVAGIGYLLHEWLAVFPRNPLARGVGVLLITATLSLSCLFGIRSYFVAWPHNHATQAAFHPVK